MRIQDTTDQDLSTEEQDTQKRLALLIAERCRRAVQTQEAILGVGVLRETGSPGYEPGQPPQRFASCSVRNMRP